MKVLGEPTLKTIARELVETVKKNVAIDWTVRENVRANLRVLVKRTLRKYGYPPDKQEQATRTVLEQAAVLSEAWAVVEQPRPREFQPRIIRPRPEDRYVTCVALVPLKAAAGASTILKLWRMKTGSGSKSKAGIDCVAECLWRRLWADPWSLRFPTVRTVSFHLPWKDLARAAQSWFS